MQVLMLRRKKTRPVIFFGGRLYWRKGVLTLIQLAYLLERKYHLNCEIVVHGTGPLFGKMKKLIHKHGLTIITLKGFTARSEFLRDMKRASFVLIPSTFEACPMLLLESMCLGKIPVMFKLPYSEELTHQGEFGILVHNVEEMALKINSFLAKIEADSLEDKIRNFAIKQYSVLKTAAEYHELYKSIS